MKKLLCLLFAFVFCVSASTSAHGLAKKTSMGSVSDLRDFISSSLTTAANMEDVTWIDIEITALDNGYFFDGYALEADKNDSMIAFTCDKRKQVTQITFISGVKNKEFITILAVIMGRKINPQIDENALGAFAMDVFSIIEGACDGKDESFSRYDCSFHAMPQRVDNGEGIYFEIYIP